MRVTLNTPVDIERIEVRAMSAGVKLHEAVLYTETSEQVPLRDLANGQVVYEGNRASETIYSGQRTQAIDVRVEGMGGTTDIRVTVYSKDYPSLNVTRF